MSAEFKENNLLGWYAECDPQTVDDYRINWSEWLYANDLDVLDRSEWFTNPGVTVGLSQTTGGGTLLWLGPCSPGQHVITNRVHTVQGRTEDQSFTLIVKDQ